MKNMSNETVSVIIPAYNADQYIEECLNSIVSQPYPYIEIIVINDGSTDKTQEKVEAFAERDPRVKLINVDNNGVSAARNLGLKCSSGEYVMFVDADDALLHGALPHMIDIQKQYEADMVVADPLYAAPGEHYENSAIRAKNFTALSDLEPLKHALKDHPATYSVWGKLYKKEALTDVKFPVGKRIHEDSFFVFKCLMKKVTMVITDAVVYKYTLSPDSASRSKFSEKYFDMLDLLDEKLKDIKLHYPELEKLSYNMIVKTNMALLQNLCKSTDPKYRQAEKTAIKQVIKYSAYFIPASNKNKVFFWIIRSHLYGLYKLYYQCRFMRNK